MGQADRSGGQPAGPENGAETQTGARTGTGAGPRFATGQPLPELPLEDLPPSRTEPDGSAVVRLLSYNIRSLRDDRRALVRVIRACAPDLVCIQEAPRFYRWRKKANWLARDCGLVTVTGGATAAGPLLLSSLRARVIRSEDVLLPRTPGLHQRGFATATVAFGRARIAVVSFHLSLNAEERRQQAGALLQRLAASGEEHVVAAGDVNERPDGKAWQRLAGELKDAHAVAPWGGTLTSTAQRPHQRIDGVFTSPSVRVLGCGVPEGLPGVTDTDLVAATDHRPVLAALHVPGRPAP